MTNLDKQGFDEFDDGEKRRFSRSLRFTPGVCTALVVMGLALQSPIWLLSMAAVAFSGALWPRGMFIDLVYNLGVGRLLHAPLLPSTPRPRRFSYALSGVLLTGSAGFFSVGLTGLGLISGGVVALGGAILTTTLFCLGSWFYRLVLGSMNSLVPLDKSGSAQS